MEGLCFPWVHCYGTVCNFHYSSHSDRVDRGLVHAACMNRGSDHACIGLRYNFKSRGVAQSGSASALGAEGRGFESLRPDQQNKGVSSKTPVSWRPPVGEFVGSRLALTLTDTRK